MHISLVKNEQYNIGHICTSQQCVEGRGNKIAIRWINSSLERTNYTFNKLDKETNKFANVLIELGFNKGDIFFTFLPKSPEQIFAFLGTLKMQAVAGTLFSNFGEESLLDRLGDSGAKGVITKKSLYKKISRIQEKLPALKTIIITDIDEHLSANVLSYSLLMKEASDKFNVEITQPDTPSVLHYTSGSTGKPKGVLHQHRSVLLQNYTSQHVLQLNENEIYWCTADQGWVTGTSYGIIGPWSMGVTQVHFGGSYDADVWMSLLENEKITIWYTAPTALRMLMREDRSIYLKHDLKNLKHIFSVGEPLNPEVIHWSRELFKKDIYDTWFQTETGSIMITNRPGLTVKPGSMGKPNGAIEAAIISDEGNIINDKKTGNLCVKAGWDSMFRIYLNNEEVYKKKFKNGYYYSGDLAYRDEDGYYWFVGRNDDVINTAGHLISPFEIESALLEIPEIAESGVIGAPDDILFEKVVAFIRLKGQFSWSDDLEMNIRLRLANKLSSIATPQEIKVIKEIPKNKSGKIMRRVLKAWYMGTDPGDISTLDE
ncbi:MAG: AMP-binding protein [Bacteroidales bacterium]|jgi:acetyl-CoA synthetase